MARRARIPTELTKGPFCLEEARKAGVTLSMLRGKAWRRLGSKLYCRSGMHEDPWKLLLALRRGLPDEAAFAGATAAWLHGLDLHPDNPVGIVVRADSSVRTRPGLNVRRAEISAGEIVSVRGFRATSLLRTLTDLCLLWPPVEALVAIDMAVASRLTDADSLSRHADAMSGRPGARRLRALAALAAPAESPMETRLRWLLIQARLPHPEVQRDLRDGDGRFVGRADLFYPAARLVLEYDGDNHRSRLVDDDRRQNLLLGAGFRLLRFTASDVHQRPEVLVAQVRAALEPRPTKRTADVRRALGAA
jgi:very-short-patch-repair endonuclease